MRDKFKWIAIIGLLAYIYYPTFVWMVDRWSARDSYYGHGFLIPILTLFWLFKKRASLASCKRDTSRVGLSILVLGVVIQVLSSLFRVYFISAISFVIVLFGIIYFLHGKQVIKQIWFPVSFLFLMIPLPLLMISQITLEMKFFVSEISTFLLNHTGIQAVRQGSYIYTRNAIVLVGDPCSGLRSFLAFLCLGFVFAYMSRFETWKRILLVSVGLPLAVFSNVIRVFIMGFLAEVYGMDLIATKVVHDGGGILVFVIALGCFLLIRKKLEGIHVRLG